MKALVYGGPGKRAWQDAPDPDLVESTVVEAGTAVSTVHVGDRVPISCITSCGHCGYCRAGRYGRCRGGGGWILGHLIDGTQAEYVRVPFADTSTYKLPDAVSDEAALLLADILPTSYEVGVPSGRVRPGGHVANIGVHGKPATLHLEDLWIKDVTITTGLATPTPPRRCSR